MFFGLRTGVVDSRGLDFDVETADIETLNRRAADGELDVTAVSFAAWPGMRERYDLLPVGSSFGLGYGPKLVSRECARLEDLAGRVVAVPGELTSAALTLRLAVPGVATMAMPFDAIPHAVASGEHVAGVVIHEGQLTYERHGLHLVADLGAWWAEETGLPLPLGATVVRRELPREVVAAVRRVVSDSILHALAHRSAAVEHALELAQGTDAATADRFVALYVNPLTLEPGDAGRNAVAEIYRRAHRASLLPRCEPRWAD